MSQNGVKRRARLCLEQNGEHFSIQGDSEISLEKKCGVSWTQNNSA
jgi:hypothetical protein